MSRSLAALVTTALAALAFVTAASAEQPVREPIFLEDIELEGLCPFPVLLEVTANKEFVTIFADGRIHITGKLFARLTNLDTGETLDLNVSGPGTITPEGEEIGRGRGLFLLRPEEPGGPGLFLTTGRAVVIRAETGFIESLTLTGRSIDVCAVLAA